MSCIFCGSFNHISVYCEKYVSDEARQERIQLHNIGLIMMKRSGLNSLETTEKIICRYCMNFKCGFAINGECNSIKKCYICYTKDQHHTVFCSDRLKAPKFFIPNINQNLLHRFLEMSNADEKYLIAFQSPAIFHENQLRPLTIFQKLNIEPEKMKYEGPNVFICKKFVFCFSSSTSVSHQRMFEEIYSKTWTFIAESISIIYNHFSTTDITLLLSSKTKILKLENTKISLKFSGIFPKVPNLQELQFIKILCDTKLVNFFKFKYENDYQMLSITVSPNFEVQHLLTILASTKQNAEINLYIDYTVNTFKKCSASQAQNIFSKNLARHFQRVSGRSSNNAKYLSIYLRTENVKTSYPSSNFLGLFTLSKRLLSKRCL